ncbi:MAG: AraC family transcriptional regulator [Clostridia bacterium]|nr:AraC family transcriptional regulator [Clostridia bacterium]
MDTQQETMTATIAPIVERTDVTKSVFPAFSENAPVYVVNTGWHKTPPLHRFGPAVRPYFLLHLIKKGKGTIERDGVTTHLSAGDAFLIQPDEITVYCSDQSDPWEYYWISFRGSYAETLIAQTTQQLCAPYQKSGELALQAAVENDVSDPIGLLNVLFEVLNCIKSIAVQKQEIDPISTALHYLERNYFRSIDISSLAFQLGFSRSYFTTVFTNKTGESPYRYLTGLRMRQAKKYLRDPHRSIEEIAYSVGFSSIERFSQLFKKYTGLSPFNYRKQLPN